MILNFTKAKEIIDSYEDRLGVYTCEMLKSTLEDVYSKLDPDIDAYDAKEELVNSVLEYIQSYCVSGPGRRVIPSVTKPFTEIEMLNNIDKIADGIIIEEE